MLCRCCTNLVKVCHGVCATWPESWTDASQHPQPEQALPQQVAFFYTLSQHMLVEYGFLSFECSTSVQSKWAQVGVMANLSIYSGLIRQLSLDTICKQLYIAPLQDACWAQQLCWTSIMSHQNVNHVGCQSNKGSPPSHTLKLQICADAAIPKYERLLISWCRVLQSATECYITSMFTNKVQEYTRITNNVDQLLHHNVFYFATWRPHEPSEV